MHVALAVRYVGACGYDLYDYDLVCCLFQLGKQCQELLLTVCLNCHTHSPEDIKVIEALISIRLKTKLFSSQFVACIK